MQDALRFLRSEPVPQIVGRLCLWLYGGPFTGRRRAPGLSAFDGDHVRELQAASQHAQKCEACDAALETLQESRLPTHKTHMRVLHGVACLMLAMPGNAAGCIRIGVPVPPSR